MKEKSTLAKTNISLFIVTGQGSSYNVALTSPKLQKKWKQNALFSHECVCLMAVREVRVSHLTVAAAKKHNVERRLSTQVTKASMLITFLAVHYGQKNHVR